jgi:hypothetical protein
MPRKIQTPIEFRLRALAVPRSMNPTTYLRSLLYGMQSGELPRGVKVELYWRNPETHSGRSKNWQSDDFLNAIAESNGGFASALERVINRKLAGGEQMAPPKEMKVRKKRKVKHGRKPKKPSTRKQIKKRAPVPGRTTRKVDHVSRKSGKLRKSPRKPTSPPSRIRTTSKAATRIPKAAQRRDSSGRFVKSKPIKRRKK